MLMQVLSQAARVPWRKQLDVYAVKKVVEGVIGVGGVVNKINLYIQIKEAFWNESRRRSTMGQFKETEVLVRSWISLNFMKEAQCHKCKYSMRSVHEKSDKYFFFF